MTCALCNQYTWRPCSRCNRPQPVCYLCGDGKDAGAAVSFGHGCGK